MVYHTLKYRYRGGLEMLLDLLFGNSCCGPNELTRRIEREILEEVNPKSKAKPLDQAY